MANRPRYWMAWQAITIISELMFQSNMVYRLYSYNAYNYLFYDFAMVQAGVLVDLSPADQNTVYTDPQYGMNNDQKMDYWVGAWLDGQDSVPYNLIVNHFATLGIDLTPTIMNNIVGLNSMLGYICMNVQVTILNSPTLGQKGTAINPFMLTQIQWGSGKVLDNPDITIANIEPIASIGDFFFDTVFTTQPEYAVYVALNGGSESDLLANTLSQTLLANDTSSYKTFLNPDNMRMFYIYYSEQAYNNIITRFGFDNNHQIDMMYLYLEQMIDDFLMFGGPSYMPTALGMVAAKSLNNSMSDLENYFPIDLTTRNLASDFNQNQLDC
jgi:hypothetical protein